MNQRYVDGVFPLDIVEPALEYRMTHRQSDKINLLPLDVSISSSGPVDCHAHVFRADLPMPDQRRAPQGYDAPIDAYMAQLSSHGIARGVLVQPSFLGFDNEYLLNALRRFPERLRGVVVMDPLNNGIDIDSLVRSGVAGIRLNLIGLPIPDFDRPAWSMFLNNLQRRHIHVELHCMAHHLRDAMEPLLAAGLTVVVDHFGRPDPHLGTDDPGFQYLLTQGSSGRVWVKLSAAYRNGQNGEAIARTASALLVKRFGLSRLVWGSDWPHTLHENYQTYSGQLTSLARWLPSPEARRIVLIDSPNHLYGFTPQ